MALARDAGLEVRVVGTRPGRPEEAPQASAICRVRGEIWVVLAGGDPVGEQVGVLCQALREHAAEYLESHFIPPALRDQLAVG